MWMYIIMPLQKGLIELCLFTKPSD